MLLACTKFMFSNFTWKNKFLAPGNGGGGVGLGLALPSAPPFSTALL